MNYSPEFRVIVYPRKNEQYVLVVGPTAEHWRLAYLAVYRWAEDPEVAFTWYDASLLTADLTATRLLEAQR